MASPSLTRSASSSAGKPVRNQHIESTPALSGICEHFQGSALLCTDCHDHNSGNIARSPARPFAVRKAALGPRTDRPLPAKATENNRQLHLLHFSIFYVSKIFERFIVIRSA